MSQDCTPALPGVVRRGAVCKNLHLLSIMAGRKRSRDTQAAAEERAMKRIDRAVKRYGPSAVAKYYSPGTSFKPEVKYFDCAFQQNFEGAANTWGTSNTLLMTSYMNADGSTVSSYTGAAIIPSAIGNGYGQVVGNKYMIKKIKVRGTVWKAAITDAVTPDSVLVRVLLVQDTQPNGAQVDPATFMTDWGSANNLINSYQAIASGSGGRIRILADKFIPLQIIPGEAPSADSTYTYYERKQFTFSKTWKKGLKVVIKSGSATPSVASLSDMNIFMVVCTSETTDGSNDSTQIAGVTRCSYVD